MQYTIRRKPHSAAGDGMRLAMRSCSPPQPAKLADGVRHDPVAADLRHAETVTDLYRAHSVGGFWPLRQPPDGRRAGVVQISCKRQTVPDQSVTIGSR